MARRVKRRKRTSRDSAQKKKARGFDYGCLPLVMAVGSLKFPDHLRAASIDAVAYGEVWSEAVNKTVPTIALVAQRGDELGKAFEEFNAWSRMTDPDSVELTFVFRNAGGYVLGISPEYSRLVRRCLGFDRAHRPMVFAPYFFKPINTVHPLLQRLRECCTQPIAPFVFDGSTYVGPRGALMPSSPPDLLPIPGLQALLKFEVTFVEEDDVTPNSIGWCALQAGSQQTPQKQSKRPKPEPGAIAEQRVKTLTHHFPVTLERIRRSLYISPMARRLTGTGVRPWQIEQALCNLILSTEMTQSVHFRGLSARKVETNIIQAISSRYELADGGDIPKFAFEEVGTQIVADGNSLLQYLDKKKSVDLSGLQSTLQAESVLDAPTAINPPAQWSTSS